ncbi:mechanosensitive ion channel family protein [Thermoflexibacter ruber]|uniref:MscS family membrane protein n=1 Tax=Thermoflexibacter ruber TaxID=1003 RepID=A0A1I2EX63_9BACT|nr:mechanosensitive ion channel family protein [Thermoflexibacter ruber]SFE97369.1 MscS family membrane protein [Thermoflexibacter ruber]
MFEEFFSKAFYGNTLFTWLVAGAIIIVSLLFGKAIYWFFSKVIKRITHRTKSKLDDILIDMLEEPVVLAIVLAGIWYAISILQTPAEVNNWIHRAYYILIIFNATWFTARLSDALIQEYAVPWTSRTRSDLDDHILPLFRKSIRITLWIVAVIIAADNAGYDLNTLIAGLGIGGLAFALAAKETLANFIAGVTIVADRPFSANQWILVKGYRAKVEEVGIRSTRFRTDKGTLVTIPNSDLVNTTIENYSEGAGITEETIIPISYEVDETQLAFAFDILREIVLANPKVANVCAISFDTMTEHALLVKFRYYVNPHEAHAAVRTEIFLEIYKQFRKHNIKIAKPIRQIELNSYAKDELLANLYQDLK